MQAMLGWLALLLQRSMLRLSDMSMEEKMSDNPTEKDVEKALACVEAKRHCDAYIEFFVNGGTECDCPLVLAHALRALRERLRRAVEVLRKIDAWERILTDAWAGGIGEASLLDLGEIGSLARAFLSEYAAAEKEDK